VDHLYPNANTMYTYHTLYLLLGLGRCTLGLLFKFLLHLPIIRM